MIAAADDPNAKAVILAMPFISGRDDISTYPPNAIADAWAERKERSTSAAATPKYIKPWDDKEEEAQGDRNGVRIHGTVPFSFAKGARELSDTAGTPWQNKNTLQSFHGISSVEPQEYLPRISPKPLLHLAANEDPLSGPPELQKKAFALAREPKEFVLLNNHHLANYFENFEETIAAQVAWLKKHV